MESNFDGGIFHPLAENGKTAGKIIIQTDCLIFKGEAIEQILPFSGLQAEIGGAGNRLIFFTHPHYPKISIYTADKHIIKHPALLAHNEFKQTLKLLKGKHTANWIWGALSVGVVLVLLWGLFWLRLPLAKFISARIPASWESKLGETVLHQLTLQKPLVSDQETLAALEKLIAPLMEVIPKDRYTFSVKIIHDSTLNAFALPGGHIVLHSGLLARAESAEEVLGVLAHEIAHVTCRHGMRKLIESAGLFLIIQSMFGDISGILAVLADNAIFLLSQKFSRDFEREADDLGFIYLTTAKINPAGMIDFFRKVKQEIEEKDKTGVIKALDDKLNFLSTHPTSDQRILRMQKKMDALALRESYIQLSQEFLHLKNQLKLIPTKNQTEKEGNL
jgi:Zn-dependent protease with chaperone function